MKVLLTTLNAKYIHSSLALRYLEKYCKKYIGKKSGYNITVREFSINEPLDLIMAEIYKTEADVIAFSCYIWNRDLIFELADRIKKVSPEKKIIMGGPEVSFDSVKIMKENSYIDYIIKGEGEVSFKELVEFIKLDNDIENRNKVEEIKGIVYRQFNQEGTVIENSDRPLIENLDCIPRPYTKDELKELENKLIYYEASRGCPFNCSYCLSSAVKGVRAFSLERVKDDLSFFINNEVKLVKFVDRTFNADRERALSIFKFLVNHQKNTSFHFEITADLLDQEMIDYLKTVPAGLFRFEIGVQTTNRKTLQLIKRNMDFTRLAENVKQLRKTDNINLHLDLIAGLPGEDYQSFAESFNDVYSLNPHDLQLGFLKLLPGSRIRQEADDFGYEFSSCPPYEVLKNRNISYQELLRLHEIAYMVDKFHNSGVFTNSLYYVFSHHYKSYFKFLEDFSLYYTDKGLNRKSHSRKSLYKILFNFYQECLQGVDIDIFRDYLKFDLLLYNQNVNLPSWAEKIQITGFKDLRYDFLDNQDNIERYLPEYRGMKVRDILKKVRFEVFNYNVLTGIKDSIKEDIIIILINYGKGNEPEVFNVTKWFSSIILI